MADHDPTTHEEQLRLVKEAKQRMDMRAREWLADPKIKSALLKSGTHRTEHKAAS